MSTKQPIAILHVLYRALGEITYPASSYHELDGLLWAARTTPFDSHRTPFYIEWLDTTNHGDGRDD